MGRTRYGFDAYDEDEDAAIPPLPSSRPPPANALEHARRMLDRALRGQAINEARMRQAGGGHNWSRASDLAGRAVAAERAAARWAQELQRLATSRGPYRFDDDPFDAAYDDGIDSAFPRISPGMTLQRAQETLARAQRAVQTQEAAFEQARRAQRWPQATQAGIRADNASRAVRHWQAVIQALRGGPYR
jgi:hypothetical protein